jgi:hypothetical protein
MKNTPRRIVNWKAAWYYKKSGDEMFGYVQPLKPELKVKELEAYKGYYCGLCKAIRDQYTHSARFMLNYDCAVLSLLLSSMSGEMPEVSQERCVVSPVKKKTIVHSREAAYAATVNVLLGCAKIEDNVADEGGIAARALSLFYRRVKKRASEDAPALAAEFENRLRTLRELEKAQCCEVDAVSAEFGQLLSAVFASAPFEFVDKGTKQVLAHFGYHLGRWIYIADAANDIEKDIKTGSYNVYLRRPSGEPEKVRSAIREEAEFNLHISLAEACKAYELLDIKRDKPLLDNIMYLGLAKKTEDVLKGETNGSV